MCDFLQIFKGLRGAQMLENMGFGDFLRYAFLGVALNQEHLPVTDTGVKSSRCGTGRHQHLLVESLVRQQFSFGSPQTLSHALGSVQDPVILSLASIMHCYPATVQWRPRPEGHRKSQTTSSRSESQKTLSPLFLASLPLGWNRWAPDLLISTARLLSAGSGRPHPAAVFLLSTWPCHHQAHNERQDRIYELIQAPCPPHGGVSRRPALLFLSQEWTFCLGSL